MNALRQLLMRSKFLLDYCRFARRSTIILSAGMPRSGSTWLFNAARLLLLHSLRHENRLGSGWIEDLAELPRREVMLLKLHDFHSLLARRARIILYSYRDLRDALASSKRKFGTEPTLAQARQWLAADRRWRQKATFCLRYESMLGDPHKALLNLADALQIPDSPLDQILGQLHLLTKQKTSEVSEDFGSLETPYNKETLLHPNHITDGRHGTWVKWLDPTLLRHIETRYAGWLESNGYPPGSSPRLE